MEKMYARCGLDCGHCLARKATVENDDALREQVAREWSAQYHADIKPADINCTGCTGPGPHFSYCGMCEIRKCANERSVAHCAVCPDFGCDKITGFMAMAPQARENLEFLRKN